LKFCAPTEHNPYATRSDDPSSRLRPAISKVLEWQPKRIKWTEAEDKVLLRLIKKSPDVSVIFLVHILIQPNPFLLCDRFLPVFAFTFRLFCTLQYVGNWTLLKEVAGAALERRTPGNIKDRWRTAPFQKKLRASESFESQKAAP
jgi:hypothetical protein